MFTELHNQGRHACKRGEYDKALGYFSRALGREKTVQLYDHRAATYEKLKDLKNALQDAKNTIRFGDADPTGYLRAGRVLVKMERSKAALDIYAYGLRHIKHVGQGFEQLKKCHDELLAELAPTNSVDPLTILPRELAASVLEYCTFRERVVICRVSKGWQKFIRSEPNLWTHLDLGIAPRKKVTNKFISVAINTAKSKLTAATLSQLFDFDKALAALLRSCPLEVLTLMQTGMQGPNLVRILQIAKENKKLRLKELKVLIGTQMSQTTLREASIACQSTLEVLSCWHLKAMAFTSTWNTLALPNLRQMNITADQIVGLDPGLNQFLTGSPQLKSLTLVNLDQAHHEAVGRLDLRGTILEQVYLQLCFLDAENLQLPTSVKLLHLVSIGPPLTGSLRLKDLPYLQDVCLDLPALPLQQILAEFENLPALSSPCSQLRSLSVKRASIAEKPAMEILYRLKELRELALLDILDLGDEEIVHMVKALPQLKSLDVSGSNMTGAGIGDMVRMGRLTKIAVKDCHRISHRDAVDFARARGVKVTTHCTQ